MADGVGRKERGGGCGDGWACAHRQALSGRGDCKDPRCRFPQRKAFLGRDCTGTEGAGRSPVSREHSATKSERLTEPVSFDRALFSLPSSLSDKSLSPGSVLGLFSPVLAGILLGQLKGKALPLGANEIPHAPALVSYNPGLLGHYPPADHPTPAPSPVP